MGFHHLHFVCKWFMHNLKQKHCSASAFGKQDPDESLCTICFKVIQLMKAVSVRLMMRLEAREKIQNMTPLEKSAGQEEETYCMAVKHC